MPNLPTDIEFGYVVMVAALAVGDTADVGSDPDATPVSGSILLTPVAKQILSTATPPTMILPQAITCTFDGTGHLIDPQGTEGVWLVVGQYDVTFSLSTGSLAGFRIEVLATHTAEDPLDLTVAAPLVVPPGFVPVVNNELYLDTVEARDAALAAAADAEAALTGFLASPAFTGNPTAPTPTTGDSDTSIANTGWVQGELALLGGGGDTATTWNYPITSGRARVGLIRAGNQWRFLDANKIYFYPVYYNGEFGVDSLGVHLRGDEAAGTFYLGLYDDSNGGFPGVPVAVASGSSGTGWKQVDITPVLDLPEGWYFHACKVSVGMDVHGGAAMAQIDAASMESAVRSDQYEWGGFVSTGTHVGALPTNPTVQTVSAPVPLVGVRFD